MLQPETIERCRGLRFDTAVWIKRLAELTTQDADRDVQLPGDLLVELVELLDQWRAWADDLDRELQTR